MPRRRANGGQQPVWARAEGRALIDLLSLRPGRIRARHCVWHVGRLGAASPDLDAAAWLIADEMMRARCGAAQPTYELWRRRATGGPALTDVERQSVEPFVEASMGLPGDPRPRDPDHVEGAVAEYVWYLTARDRVEAHRTLRRIEKPSLLASEPGGDGLTIYQLPADGSLTFRLWEVKKATGQGSLSRVVTRACNQIAERGRQYLAKYASQAAHLPDDELVDLYGNLGERWITWDSSAGAGVAISTSEPRAPDRAFSQMHRLLPNLCRGDQLEGLIAGIGDFSAFAVRVRDFLWSGL